MEAGPEYRSDEVNVFTRIMCASTPSRRIFPDSDYRVVWRVPASQAQALLLS